MPLNKLAYSLAKRDSALTKRGVAKQYVAAVGQAPRLDARVAELVDAPDLGSGAFGREGSTPFARTIFLRPYFRQPNHCLINTNSEQEYQQIRWCLFWCLFFIA